MNGEMYYPLAIFLGIVVAALLFIFRKQIVEYAVSKRWIQDFDTLMGIVFKLQEEIILVKDIVADGKVTEEELKAFADFLANKYIDLEKYKKMQG